MKIIVLMLCSFFCVQVALAQETSVDSVTVSKEKMFLIEKAKQDRIIAEQKLIKEAEKQVVKSKLFTKTTLTQIQDKMRNACIKSFNKFYDMDFKLKEKQKGRNQDINVKDMGDYRKIKKQLAKKEQKLEKANT